MTSELPAGLQLELRRIEDDRLITRLEAGQVEEIPQPGRWLTVAEGSFLVLQRRHRYRLRNGRYELSSVALQVRPLGDRGSLLSVQCTQPPAALRRAAGRSLRTLQPLP
jgi:hypothetical protein